jgi:P-loop Domain of unknown function (DUF2791)
MSSTKTSASTPTLARALLRSLTRGTAIPQGVRHIHVGHAKWLTAQLELLDEVAEDGFSDTKFVRGAYGSGKSHFLSLVQDHARERGWITSHVECKVDGVQIDRFETLYPRVVAKLSAQPDLGITNAAGEEILDPIAQLLDRWTERTLLKIGVKDFGRDRPLDSDMRLHEELQRSLLRSSLPYNFTSALTAYARASIGRDSATQRDVSRWLRGDAEKIILPGHYLASRLGSHSRADVTLRPIGKGTASEVMRGLLWLIRTAGYTGLVLCIDEIEELAKLGNQRRQDQALQALREHVDHAGGEAGFRHLVMYLAATPEMFENERYFPRYDALATRIQPLGGSISWHAPVIDLDRTPLSLDEMRALALKLREVHCIAYGEAAANRVTADAITSLVDHVAASRFRVAKPRLLTRLLVEELERARQAGDGYAPPENYETALGRVAARVEREAAA